MDDEQTTPAGHNIPVPSRDEALRDLAKVAKAKREKRDKLMEGAREYQRESEERLQRGERVAESWKRLDRRSDEREGGAQQQ